MKFARSIPILLTIALASVLAGCAERPTPAPPPRPVVKPALPPVPVAPPAPQLGEDWRDWPLAPGNWAYRRDARGGIALFGVAGSDALFTIRCDSTAGQVFLSRAGAFPDGESGRMTVRTTSGLATFPVANAGSTPAYVATRLTPRDPQLDNMAYSRGRFVVSVKGATDLVIPAWPEFARVVEDCRG